MISKLKAHGFNDELCDLLPSYLCNRLNRVKLGAFRSEWKRTDRGCPQGSALGPLLWNIFQNDLTYVITSHLSIYANDHQMYEFPDLGPINKVNTRSPTWDQSCGISYQAKSELSHHYLVSKIVFVNLI